jgi:hypothetical protein
VGPHLFHLPLTTSDRNNLHTPEQTGSDDNTANFFSREIQCLRQTRPSSVRLLTETPQLSPRSVLGLYSPLSPQHRPFGAITMAASGYVVSICC